MKYNNVTVLPTLDSRFLPCQLDAILNIKINEYLKESTLSDLAREIDEYTRSAYRNAWNDIETGRLTEKELDKHIRSHCPTRACLVDYTAGRPICFRHINTIANFFGVNFSIVNFNPSDELTTSLDMREN